MRALLSLAPGPADTLVLREVPDPVAPDETLGEVVHPAVLPPPLPVVMGLESTPWHAGDTALLTATDAIPGAKVYFLAGSGIGSTCLAKLGGDCVDLKRPALRDIFSCRLAIPSATPAGRPRRLRASLTQTSTSAPNGRSNALHRLAAPGCSSGPFTS